MAILGTEGFGSLPRYCTLLMGVLFAAAVAMCATRDLLPRRYARFVPSPMSMGLPFYLGGCGLVCAGATVCTHYCGGASSFVPSPMSMGGCDHGPLHCSLCAALYLMMMQASLLLQRLQGLLSNLRSAPSLTTHHTQHTTTYTHHPPHRPGANNALNFWIGSLIVHAWDWAAPASSDALATIAGSGLIVGAGLFAVPAAVLSLAGALPPICMSFSAAPPKSS